MGDARSHLSVITVRVEVGHDQHPDRLAHLIEQHLTQALEDRGAVVWGSSVTWRDPAGSGGD